MTRKKQKNAEAENLIASLMDELQPEESSIDTSLKKEEKKIPEGLEALNPDHKKQIWGSVEGAISETPEDATLALGQNENKQPISPSEKTVAVGGFNPNQNYGSFEDKIMAPHALPKPSGSVYVSTDASLLQAENLKIAQKRILELEKELEKLRAENEELASAAELIKSKLDDYNRKFSHTQKEKEDIRESLQNEILILKGNLQYKENEVAQTRLKNEELDARIKADFRKIRVRERELENRLELVRAEKVALVKAKDEQILDLKRKIDHLQSELDNYRGKVLDLNKTIDQNQDQFKRTVRALRLALSNLEIKDDNIVPLKKAE